MKEVVERNAHPGEIGIHLVQPGETFEVDTPDQDTGEHYTFNYFFGDKSREKHIIIPELGDIRLSGGRKQLNPEGRPYPITGFTVQNGALVTGDFFEMEDQYPDLFDLGLDIEPAVALPASYVLVCRMHLEGLDIPYQAIMEFSKDIDSSTNNWLDYWKSLDPTDTNKYAFMVSPYDTSLLSNLSFSFHTERMDETS